MSQFSAKATWLVVLILFVLSFSTAACAQLKRELAPEKGRILYAAIKTPTDFVHATGVSYHSLSTGGTAPQTNLAMQIPLHTPLNYPCPAWTDDGRYIAFNDARNITILDTRENERREIEVDFDFLMPVVWSPDGTRLAFSGNPEVDPFTPAISTVWLMDLTTMTWRPLLECQRCFAPTWHPDGSLVAFVNLESDMIEILDINTGLTGGSFPVPNLTLSTYGEGALLSWSPTGDKIAFAAITIGGRKHVYILSLKSGEIRDLTPREERADSPTWSPSGRQILYRVVQEEEPPLPDEGPWLLNTSFVIRSLEQSGDFTLRSAQTSPILSCPNWLPQLDSR